MSSSNTRKTLNVLVRPWFIVTILCLIYCLAVIVRNDGDPLALVTIGTRFSEGIPTEANGTEGYDGQFVYYIARDPSTAASFIAAGDDIPAYRFQRILLPALGMVLSWGQDDLIPWALLIVNLISLAVGTALLENLLKERRISRWFVLGYALSLGIFGTVRLSLPEPLAYALVLGGITLMNNALVNERNAYSTLIPHPPAPSPLREEGEKNRSQRLFKSPLQLLEKGFRGEVKVGTQHTASLQRPGWLWAAILFALAVLAKETTLIFPAAYGLHMLLSRRWREAALFGVIVLTPFILWQLVLYDRLGEFGVGSGGALATGFEIIPFAGILRILTEGGIVVFIVFIALLGPFVIFPILWGLQRAWQEIRQKNYEIPVLLLAFNAGVMLFVPFSTYREPLGILRFIVGLQIAVILYAAEKRSFRALRNSTIWMLTMAFLISSDFAAMTQ